MERCATMGVLLAVLAVAGCDGVGEADPVDFYVTVHLQTGFKVNVVDRLEVVFQAAPGSSLEQVEGEDFEGGISWETREGDRGDEFVVNTTGDYFRTTAAEVAQDTWELDIPFQDGSAEGSFGLYATVYWEDESSIERDVGYGTAASFELPRPANPPVVVEVTCRDAFQYTCRTGCAPSVNPCDDREDCGSGTWACVEGCCVEG